MILSKMKKSFNKQQDLIPMITTFSSQIYRNYNFLVKKENYRKPNTKAARQIATEKKKKYFLKKCIKTICDRYFINYFEQDLERIVEKSLQINKVDNTYKGLLQTTAAVVLGEYWDQIRTKTIKQFCNINGLTTNIFNQKYKTYQKIYGQELKKEKTFRQIQSHFEQQESQKQTILSQVKEGDELCQISNPLKAISLVQDILFKSDYFLMNRRSVIQKFNSTFKRLTRESSKRQIGQKLPLEKIYHVFCAILRHAKSQCQIQGCKKCCSKKIWGCDLQV